MTSALTWMSSLGKRVFAPGHREYAFYLIIIISATLLSFFKSVYFAKKLPAEEFGIYSLVLTSYAFLLYLGSFGASEYMLKMGAREFRAGGKDAAVKIRTNALLYGFFTTVALSLLVGSFGAIFIPSHFSVLLMSALIAVPAICYNVFDAYYRSARMHLWFSGMLFCKASVILIFAFFLIEKFGLSAAVGAEIFGFVLIFLSVFAFDFKSFKATDVNSFRDELSLMAKHGVPTILVNMTRNVSLMFERYFISFALGFVALGEYSFVMIIYQSSIMGGGILVNVLGPKWLALYAADSNHKHLFKTISRFSVGIVLLSIVVYPLFYFGLPMILAKFFEKYNFQEVISMAHIVYWTSLSYLIVCFLDWFYIATSKERVTLTISIVCLIFLAILFAVCYYLKIDIVYYALAFLLSRVLALVLMLVGALRATA